MGAGTQEGKCPLCNQRMIQRNVNSGFEACHIVARRYFQDEMLTRFYLIPGCAACNNECGDTCLLDFLWLRFRFVALRRIISIIYTAFMEEHGMTLSLEDRMAWKVLQHLYGATRFPTGGIINTTAIYELARAQEAQQIIEESAQWTRKLEENTRRLNALLTSTILPVKLL